MKSFGFLIYLLAVGAGCAAQTNKALAATIDSLYEADQSVQWTLKGMYERNAPQDSLRRQDSLKRATYVHGLAVVKHIYAQYGYPTAAMVGSAASHHFFVLIQHADADARFQVEMLPILDKLSSKGEIERKDYAYLYDRVQRNTGGKQLYGTQPSYGKDGALFDSTDHVIYPSDLVDPTHVNERRKAVGLGPIEAYYEGILEMLGRPRKKRGA